MSDRFELITVVEGADYIALDQPMPGALSIHTAKHGGICCRAVISEQNAIVIRNYLNHHFPNEPTSDMQQNPDGTWAAAVPLECPSRWEVFVERFEDLIRYKRI